MVDQSEAEADHEECRLCGEPYMKAVVGDECHSLSVPDAERVCVYSHGVNATVFIHGGIQ